MGCALDEHRAGGGQFKAGDHAQGGGLAAAARPQQREKLAVLDGKVYVAHRLHVAAGDGPTRKNLAQLPQLHGVFAHASALRGAGWPTRRSHSEKMTMTTETTITMAARVTTNGRRLGKRNCEYR